MSKHHYSFLALGDSYTIGESVALYESFSYQTVQLFRKAGLSFQAPEIIAKTGWTSFELAEQLLHTQLSEPYDLVTLLIGVNNQYRNLPIDEFQTDIGFLIRKAIHLSGEKNNHVVLFSIPDWGVTPFAAKKEAKKISEAIDAFNQICQSSAQQYNCHYLDITEELRKAKKKDSLLASDNLHYSAITYLSWAEKLVGIMKPVFYKQK